jgi:hypothetical protein
LAEQAVPQNMSDFIDLLSESPDDVAAEPESRAGREGLDAEQSSESTDEQVAPDEEDEQTDDMELDGVEEGDGSPDPETPDATASWDSDENPYRAAALAFAELQRLAEQQAALAAQQSKRQSWQETARKLTEIDEDDVDALTGELIEDIRHTEVAPYLERIEVLEHGLTAAIAAIEEEGDEAVARIKARAAAKRNLAASKAELESVINLERNIRKEASAREAALQKQVRNLKAQLAAKVITESGANRTETVAVGANDPAPSSWDDFWGEGRI